VTKKTKMPAHAIQRGKAIVDLVTGEQPGPSPDHARAGAAEGGRRGVHYNFARPHQTLSKRFGPKTTPVMAAGKADHVWSVWEIAGLLD
jgi:hypothetical protein